MKRHLACTLFLVTLMPAAAFAQNKTQPAEEGYTYHIETDFLDGSDLRGDGPRLVVRKAAARVQLIRPRTSFVSELLKSTEAL